METAIELSRGALSTAIELALPVMVVGLAVGVIVSVFQAMTQVHDQTLSFIPKILAMVAVILLLLPWFLKVMEGYTRTVFEQLGDGFFP
ncbi:MAG: flagellar biosynthesis protein FliQ [Planctomycetota bacterium]|jgi:flagellar biosynthetic protein FliQ|nr:flagellar biosynthetic protein FliQ [Planctomycetota bacterium]MCH2580437.1 flagellar biosynthesis protein FliQ [Planctomycetota bacterium]MCS5628555.1 flagellar biosynthesis protein FliQ [Planctomycetota bacterium]MEC7775486.1 flagellar biosynthesis protein FliQ [Planctomycetota bacterium]MEC9031371.1 flagellar biosynthesis protein FliQ [Planctomycetota bacterium]|tara:strand:+ start:355 stop:621 length:267 start_codon:yes stop_codon:yes gene_type:complete